MLETVSKDFFVTWAIPAESPTYSIHVHRRGGNYPLVEIVDDVSIKRRLAHVWLPAQDEPAVVGFYSLMESLSSAIVWMDGGLGTHREPVVVDGTILGFVAYEGAWRIDFPAPDERFEFQLPNLMRQMWLGSTYLDDNAPRPISSSAI